MMQNRISHSLKKMHGPRLKSRLSAATLASYVARAVRNSRMGLGWTQADLASRLETSFSRSVPQSYVSQLEQGVRPISLDRLESIATALNVSASKLLQRAERLRKLDHLPPAEVLKKAKEKANRVVRL